MHQLMRGLGMAFRRGSLTPTRWREVQKVISEAADKIEQLLGGQ